jgi:hypothetical protein
MRVRGEDWDRNENLFDLLAGKLGSDILVVARFDTDVVVFVWWSEDLWASQTCLSISACDLDVID